MTTQELTKINLINQALVFRTADNSGFELTGTEREKLKTELVRILHESTTESLSRTNLILNSLQLRNFEGTEYEITGEARVTLASDLVLLLTSPTALLSGLDITAIP